MTTMAQRVDTVTSFLRAFWQVALLAGALVAVLLLVRTCNRADTAEAALKRAQEAGKLKDAGFLVALQSDQKALEAKAAAIPALQAEIERLKKASPGIRIVRVDRIVTAPAGPEGPPLPTPAPGAPCPECYFAAGNQGRLEIDSVTTETREGVQVAHVAGGCVRTSPEPPARFLSGLGSATVSTMDVEPVPLDTDPGWGGGALAGIGTQGATGEVVVLSPPFLSEHLSAVGAVQLGAGPSGAIMVGLVWR